MELDQRIGIIGGGQLGKMMLQEAKKMGLFVTILDPTPDCPAHSLADGHIVASFDDAHAIDQLAKCCDVLTYELEHINVEALATLEAKGHIVHPSAHTLRMIQNKFTQKTQLRAHDLPVPDFVSVGNMADMTKAGEQFGYPFLLKACTGGYDGKGNALVATKEQVEQAYNDLGKGKIPLMAEQFVPFVMEVSVITCHGTDGSVAVYDVCENTHKDNILLQTMVPANIAPEVTQKALNLAAQTLEVFQGVGVFCVEMFVTPEGDVLINEVAPRPHNSGHYTIEASVTSQFEQHIRAICGLPLGSTRLVSPAIMCNLLAQENFKGKAIAEGVVQTLAIEGLSLHIYGKKQGVSKRKMGHFTVIAPTLEEAVLKAKTATIMLRGAEAL